VEEGKLIIPLIEAIVYVELSDEKKGELLLSEIRKEEKLCGVVISISGKRYIGPTKGYYTFFVRLPISQLQEFKDFLREFCKETKMLNNI